MVYKIYLQAEQKAYITSGIQSITTILNTILCVVLIKIGSNIQVVKMVSSFIFILRPVIQNIYVRKKYDINLRSVKEKYELKQKWDGLAQHIAAVIHGNTDITVLTIFSNTAEISVYTVYLFVIKGVKNLVQALTGGIDASFGDMYAKNEKSNLNKSFKTYEFFYFSIITIVFTSTLCLIVPFVQVYTKGITDVDYIRPLFGCLLVLSEYIWAIRLPYSSLILAVGHFKETRRGAWVEAISNTLISLILVNKFGIIGVTIGTLFAMAIRTIEFMYHSAKYILEREMKYSFIHLAITTIETIIIFIISNIIIKNTLFTNYFVWIKYAFMVVIVATIVTLIINCILYRKQAKETIELIKRNFLKKGKV